MPSLPSASVQPSSSSSFVETKKAAQKALAALDVQRKGLESEAEAIVDELTTAPEDGGTPMGIDTPLTDVDGYPRSDIDVYRARTLRHRLSEIKTDHAELMKKIEQGLSNVAAFSKPATEEEEAAERAARLEPKPKPKFDPVTGKWVVMNWDGSVGGVPHGEERSFQNLEQEGAATLAESPTQQLPVGAVAGSTSSEPAPRIPFAVVDAVAADSPAEAAGLHEGDLVVEFGTANHRNHRNLKAIAELVPMAAGDQKEIPIVVLRRRQLSVEDDVAHGVEAGVRETKNLKILPRPWGGRGLLGCHIKGYSDTTDYTEPC